MLNIDTAEIIILKIFNNLYESDAGKSTSM